MRELPTIYPYSSILSADSERVYVVLYRDYEGSSLLWAGVGKDAAVKAVHDARAGIEEADRANREILGEEDHERDLDAVTENEWAELRRRQGPFGFYSEPERVCVLKETAPFRWECCCGELGVASGEPIIVGP